MVRRRRADHPDQPGRSRTTPARPSWPQAIQDGLAAKAAGDDGDGDDQARPGRAARRRDRQRGGHRQAAQGRRHRGRRDRHRAAATQTSSKLDEMALDTASTKTTRVREVTRRYTCPNGHTSTADRLLRHLRRADRCRRRPCRRRGRAGPPRLRPPSPAHPRAAPDAPPAAGEARTCPNCGTDNPADALFCEACGYDFTTGTMPRPRTATAPERPRPGPASAPRRPPRRRPAPRRAAPEARPRSRSRRQSSGWPRCGSTPTGTPRQESDDPCPSPGLPVVVPLARAAAC